ncbi:zinc-binding dehydrogenase [Candidatus Woesearchaeota archaeon]|nr:zinc-binding dehydrogenase [Candidatus Woesearchaeota archaeon]
MKAIILHNKGDASQLKYEEVETPKINDDEALVKIKAASVNHLDIWVREGNVPANYPIIPGCEAAGDIAEIGKNVKDFKKGDKVLVHPRVTCGKCEYCFEGNDNLCKNAKQLGVTINGCYAEYVKAPKENLYPMNDKISYEEAASVPITFGTAYRVLISLAKIKLGETVLIMAVGSGVGTAALQIAKLAGATVIAAAGNDEKLDKAKELGADLLVNYYRNQNFDEEVRYLANGNGVDVVVEQIGGNILPKALKCLRKGGRLITLGTTAGNNVEIDAQHFYRNNLAMIGTSGTTHKEVRKVFELVKQEKLKPVIDKVFSLKDASLAHKYMEERKNFGKIVLKP